MSLISPDFLTMQELAALKNVTVRTVQIWIKQGIAPRYEPFLGKKMFYKKDAIAFVKPRRGRNKKKTQ